MSNRNKKANKSANNAKQMARSSQNIAKNAAKSSKDIASASKQAANEKPAENEKPLQENKTETQNANTVSRMKRAMSLTGVVFLLALYLLTFVLAITDNSASLQLFYASVVATIVIPVLIWGYLLIYRLMNKEDDKEDNQ